MSDAPLLVNNLYPVEYFGLKGVDPISFPNRGPWISASRYAAVGSDRESYLTGAQGGSSTSEYLEIDLGYIRTINYVTFDIQTAPVSIKLEYDTISSPGQSRSWVQVTPMPGMPFDDVIRFTPQSLHGWFNADMYFTDPKSNPVQTRYLRFTFTRQDPWPIQQQDPARPLGIHDTFPPNQFRWPISVRNLRAGLFTVPNPGRSALGLIEATGLLFQQEPIGLIPFLPDVDVTKPGGKTGTQVRQRFVIPDSAVRGYGPQMLVPTILGFGVFINVPIPILLGNISTDYLATRVKFGWELWDVTSTPARLNVGIETGALVFGDQWIDVYFDRPPTVGPPNPPPPPTKTETHCGIWEFYVCKNDPNSVLHWYWYDSTAKKAYLTAPPGAPVLPLPQLGGVLGPINENAPHFPCGESKAGGTWIPQNYCWPVTVSTSNTSATVENCGYWRGWALADDDINDLTVILYCYWWNTTTSTASISTPAGAPPKPVGYKLQVPPTVAYQEAPIVKLPPGGVGYSAGSPFCYPAPPPPPPPGGPPPPAPPPGVNNKIYELRVWSLDTDVADQFYLSEPNNLSARNVPGTLDFSNGSASVPTSTDLTLNVKSGDWLQVNGVFATVESGDIPLSYQVVSVSATAITLDRVYAQPTLAGATAIIVYPLYGWDGSAYIPDGQQNIAMRLWGDVGASGKDVLGNSYRYATKEKQANDVLINSKSGWTSAPMPSQNAVEALYFDVRDVNELGEKIYRVLDAMEISPLTPGVQMSIYYSQSNLVGASPIMVDDWDYLLWTPVSNHTFMLNRKMTLQFPHQIRAAYMKLEFTALQPLPYFVPTFPPFPPQIYRRYPTWIEEQFDNSQVRQRVQEWWLRNSTPVEINILNTLRDPIREFEYEEGLMFAILALSTPPANTTLTPPTPPIDVKTAPINVSIGKNAVSAALDPITGSKIHFSPPNRFSSSLLSGVDQQSVLGQAVIKRFDPTLFQNQSERLPPPIPASTVPSVSTPNNRITDAFSFLSNTPMRFNKTCRHVYRSEWGEFNKKAYFVGINEVKFLRADYTVKHDDFLIRDILHDDLMLSENNWYRSAESTIPDGAKVFVNYRVDETDFVDEEITLNGNIPVLLQGKGPHLFNMLIYSLHQKLGVQYFENDDFTISLGIDDESGVRTYFLSRSALAARLESPPHPTIYDDSAIVIGIGHPLPGNTWSDAATVTGVGMPLTHLEYLGSTFPTYGENTYGTGTYGAFE